MKEAYKKYKNEWIGRWFALFTGVFSSIFIFMLLDMNGINGIFMFVAYGLLVAHTVAMMVIFMLDMKNHKFIDPVRLFVGEFPTDPEDYENILISMGFQKTLDGYYILMFGQNNQSEIHITKKTQLVQWSFKEEDREAFSFFMDKLEKLGQIIYVPHFLSIQELKKHMRVEKERSSEK